MPELPECEYGRKVAHGAAAGRRIVGVICAPDDIVYDGVTPRAFAEAVRGRRVEAVKRRGKHIWFELDRRPWPLFHFGMTGSFRVPDRDALPLATGPRPGDATWPPRFTKLRLRFEDDGELALVNARRLGRIRLREDPATEPPIGNLGFDPLLDLPSPAAFASLLARRTGRIKGVLLDQSFAAGVGNWIADEALYQARLDPRRRASDLADGEIRRLRAKLGHIVRRAVAVDADKGRFPRTWLFHRRWGKDPEARTAAGEPIQHITVAGRTTAWVPSTQH